MTWMNEYDIEEALRHTAYYELPVLRQGAEILSRLKDWTNSHSDGWPYWQKPANSASKLSELLMAARRNRYEEDITEAELKKALSPIKAFLTRQGVDHALILEDPPPVSMTYINAIGVLMEAAQSWAGELTEYIIPADEDTDPETTANRRKQVDRIHEAIKLLTPKETD